MLATKLQGQITRDRRLVVQIPRDMETGMVEVILLHLPSPPTKRRARRGATHPAFGIWAKRSDMADTASFAAQLRQRVESRADGDAPA
jgi:hypothetical protein